MKIIELRSEETEEINEEIFSQKVMKAPHAVVMIHFIQ